MDRLRILAYGSALLAAAVFFYGPGAAATQKAGHGLVLEKSWLTNSTTPLTPVAERRPPDQTFLTFPEWFLVFGPAEQAEFFQQHTATKFPFMMHVRQIWGGYDAVYDQINGNFKFNTGYHVMIMVIATSSTAEFGLKSVYETLIGRLTDTPDGAPMTEEDQFNAKFTRDYVTFLDTEPWYKFDFASRLAQLWTKTSWTGEHPVRKWERKWYLTTELAFKTIYGRIIWGATRSAYEPPKPTTAVVADHLPGAMLRHLPDVTVVTNFPGGVTLITLPRYAPFVTNACELAAQGTHFREIAGNSSAVLITVLAPKDWGTNAADYRIIFTQPIPTKPDLDRVALATPVASLDAVLRKLAEDKIAIEHVYDF